MTADNAAIPVSIRTFDRIAMLLKKGKTINGNPRSLARPSPFGDRFLDKEEIWRRKMRIKNHLSSSGEVPRDSSPSPGAYSLISHWQGKVYKKKDEPRPNFLERACRGPSVNAYYSDGNSMRARII